MTTSSIPGTGSSTSAHVSTSGPPGWGIVTAYMGFLLPRQARQPFIYLDVARAGPGHHVVGHGRPGRGLVPPGARGPVPHDLLVEGVLVTAGLPRGGVPEP